MDLFFESSQGIVKFSGKRQNSDCFFIKEIDGLGLPARSCRVTEYANQPGQELILQKDEARMITLLVDALGLHPKVLRNIAKVLYQPGVLTLCFGNEKRKISCRLLEFEEDTRRGGFFISFILQFVCDKPYFTDEKPCRSKLFYRKDLIESSFMLPCVFTERINQCTLVNQGDVQAEPIFVICGMSEAKDTRGGSAGLAFMNHTTGKKLLLETTINLGEIITVDIAKRSIVSSVRGNLISALSQDSHLAEFYLAEGPNLLEVESYDEEVSISVTVSYENQYVGIFF